jgi:hypothetical protein
MADSLKLITFDIAHQILQMDKCNRIAIHLHLLATNLNANKPIDISIIPNINEY